MAQAPSDVNADSPQAPGGRRLDSWKEIAAHLKRDVATVRRWEKREGLPVHRHLHEKLGSVFAYTDELDAWKEGRRAPGESANGVTSDALLIRPAALAWTVSGVLAVLLVVMLMLWAPWKQMPAPSAVHLAVELTADASLSPSAVGAATILSADGAVVAFVAPKIEGGGRQLYVRPLNQRHATALAETDQADSPFFSPDGKWIAFFANSKLKKISISGGSAIVLSDAPNGRGGAWAEDGTIVFSPDAARVALLQVPSAGGKPAPLTSLAEGEITHRWPQVLPGGRGLMYTASNSPGDFSEANLVVQRLPRGERKIIHRGAYYGRYLPSGHLIYMHEGKLLAAPFDLERLEVTGPSVTALEDVASNADTGGAQFAASATGTLIYVSGPSVRSGALIFWMNEAGTAIPLRSKLANWSNILFAPDGRRLAMQIAGPGPSDIWLYEWAQDNLTRLTFAPAFDSKPVWTPTGRRIGFASARADASTLNLYWQQSDGSGEAQRLTQSKNQQRPSSWHPSGRFLAFEEQNATTSWDLMILPMEGSDESGLKPGKPTVFLNTPSAEREPMFSPDGNWLAYHANESGQDEVYVRPFPGPGSGLQISAGGGSYATWSRTNDALFYGLNGQIMIAEFAVDGHSFRAKKARLWSSGRYLQRAGNRGLDLHPDGERFAVAVGAEAPSNTKQGKVIVVFNFFDELRRIAPTR